MASTRGSLARADSLRRTERPSVVEDPRIALNRILAYDGAVRTSLLEQLIKELEQGAETSPDSHASIIQSYAPSLFRLSLECPYSDVRRVCQDFVDWVKQSPISQNIDLPQDIGPSMFFPKTATVPVEAEGATRQLFEDIFATLSRIPHFQWLMAWYPDYLRRFIVVDNFIMRQQGPLPIPWRHYLAIMAAARHDCYYLVSLQEQEFLANGGSPIWLLGLDYAPPKLRNIAQLNALLCHTPWLITRNHVENLVKGADAWSMGELVHALVLLSTFHSLCGFIYGMGVTPELDLAFDAPTNTESESSAAARTTDPLTQTSDSSSKTSSSTSLSALDTAPSDQDATAGMLQRLKNGASELISAQEDDKAQVFEKAGSEVGALDVMGTLSQCADLSRFTGDASLRYVDFNVKSAEYSIFRVQDYCWEDHGYELVNQFYQGAAQLLDDEFTYIYNMTDQTFGENRGIDTLPFRRAVWYYVHRLYGMSHDDYDYREVNVFLPREVKAFTKKIACTPEFISQTDFHNLILKLRPEEKCHIILLSWEAKRQAELLYGLHAVMKHMS
eukprot:GILJ01008064.1.p1 GENE.GILJ01008064.1~~GILJ01008064.1.p1  ORF type:complete len:558 (-),score=46.77 GILJ01008064.1:368-2041(-)